MNIATLNEILAFVECPYRAEALIVKSGQREVYLAKQPGLEEKYVIKIAPPHPMGVARIQREIKILDELNSPYFPKFFFQFYVTDEELVNFIDNFDPKEHQSRIAELKAMSLKSFFITAEQYIEHLPWADCLTHLRDEKNFIDFLLHIFSALQILWDKKIVHRDLKPH